MKKTYIIVFLLVIITASVKSQPSLDYWNYARYLKLSAGTVSPGTDFSDTSESGLFAKDGYQIGLDYNLFLTYGFGFGFDFEFNRFRFNEEAFFSYANPDYMKIGPGYSSTKFGLNLIYNIPVVVHPDAFTINLFIEGNAGLRGMSIPSIDLEYDEIVNYYVDITYMSRSSVMGYLGYNTGVQLIFSNRFGVNVSYNTVIPRRQSIRYSVRKFNASGDLYEDESYVSNNLDHTGLQFGIMFIFGK